MITKVIGIISWLPNDSTRIIRQKRLEELLVKCDNLFNLPIIVIAQNWDETIKTTKNCVIFNFDKLGLTVDKNYKFSYFSSFSSAGLICASIINPHLYKTICINDTSENDDKERENIITKHFESQFSQKSKYEKT